MRRRYGIPDRWGDYSNFKGVINECHILPCKTPLKEQLFCKGINMNLLEQEQHFTPQDLCRMVQDSLDKKVEFVIDFTNTSRYYDFTKLGETVKYFKVECPGKQIPPQNVYTKFHATMETCLRDISPQGVIAVHCTHGVNRTGFIICNYLMNKYGYCLDESVKMFDEARGHDIERAEYIQALREEKYPEPSADELERLEKCEATETIVTDSIPCVNPDHSLSRGRNRKRKQSPEGRGNPELDYQRIPFPPPPPPPLPPHQFPPSHYDHYGPGPPPFYPCEYFPPPHQRHYQEYPDYRDPYHKSHRHYKKHPFGFRERIGLKHHTKRKQKKSKSRSKKFGNHSKSTTPKYLSQSSPTSTHRDKVRSLPEDKESHSLICEDKTQPLSLPIEDKTQPLSLPTEDKTQPLSLPTEDKTQPLSLPIEDKTQPLSLPIEDKTQPLSLPIEDKTQPLSLPIEDKTQPLSLPIEEEPIQPSPVPPNNNPETTPKSPKESIQSVPMHPSGCIKLARLPSEHGQPALTPQDDIHPTSMPPEDTIQLPHEPAKEQPPSTATSKENTPHHNPGFLKSTFQSSSSSSKEHPQSSLPSNAHRQSKVSSPKESVPVNPTSPKEDKHPTPMTNKDNNQTKQMSPKKHPHPKPTSSREKRPARTHDKRPQSPWSSNYDNHHHHHDQHPYSNHSHSQSNRPYHNEKYSSNDRDDPRQYNEHYNRGNNAYSHPYWHEQEHYLPYPPHPPYPPYPPYPYQRGRNFYPKRKHSSNNTRDYR